MANLVRLKHVVFKHNDGDDTVYSPLDFWVDEWVDRAEGECTLTLPILLRIHPEFTDFYTELKSRKNIVGWSFEYETRLTERKS